MGGGRRKLLFTGGCGEGPSEQMTLKNHPERQPGARHLQTGEESMREGLGEGSEVDYSILWMRNWRPGTSSLICISLSSTLGARGHTFTFSSLFSVIAIHPQRESD